MGETDAWDDLLLEDPPNGDDDDMLRVTFGSVEIREYHVTSADPSTSTNDNNFSRTLTWDPHRITISTVDDFEKRYEDTPTTTTHSSWKQSSKEERHIRETKKEEDI